MNYTVIGGRGFIGSEIVHRITEEGYSCSVPDKGCSSIFDKPLVILIYAAGHGDCQRNPEKVFDSNLGYLTEVLTKANYERFIYISSTRVYMNQVDSLENSDLKICFSDNRSLFNLTKLTAEELVLRLASDSIVVRPSNVYGLALSSPLFLPSIVRDAIEKGLVNMFISEDYEKDYVSVIDVSDAIFKLSLKSFESNQVFNVASGANTRADTIANVLIDKTGCKVNWIKSQVDDTFAPVDISKLKSEIEFNPSSVEADLEKMIMSFREYYNKNESFVL